MTSKGETKRGSATRPLAEDKNTSTPSPTRRGSALARSIAAAHDATPEDTGTSNRRRRGESSPRDGSVALRRNGSSRRRPGADPGGGDRRSRSRRAGARVARAGRRVWRYGGLPRGGPRAGRGRWRRDGISRVSGRLDSHLGATGRADGLGLLLDGLLGRLLGSLALRDRKRGWGARMSRRSGRVGRPRSRGRRARRDASGAPVSRRVREPENLRGDCTQISRCRDRVTRCDGAYLGADAEGDAALGGGLRGELAVGDGSEEAGRGVRGAPEGGVSGSAIAPRKTYRLERLRYRGADVIARKTTRPTQSTVAHLETAARAASWGAAATKAAIAAVVTFTTSVCTGCWYAAGVGCELALVPVPPPTSAQSSADCSHGGL